MRTVVFSYDFREWIFKNVGCAQKQISTVIERFSWI